MDENKRLNVELNKSNDYIFGESYEIFYANALDVQVSITDLMVDFKQHTPSGFLSNKKIIMNPSLAKQLNKALEQALSQYENMHGTIKDIDTLQNEMSKIYGDE
ncbi:TPA: DUF3467 domain-containing protein [Staphylococcus aureus]|nr:DUF3467 domain-containing protein [Staphylococcus aureus]